MSRESIAILAFAAEGSFFFMLQEFEAIQNALVPSDSSKPHHLRWYLTMTMKLWGNHIAGPILAAITILFVIVSALVSGDSTTTAKLVKWSAWVTGIATVCLMFRAQYDTWTQTAERAEIAEARLKEIENAKPVLKLNTPDAVYVESVMQWFKDNSGTLIHEQETPFLKIRFVNDPETPYPTANANGVRAYIDYYRLPDNGHVLHIDGRWAESTQPSAYIPQVSKAPLLAATFGIGEAKSVDVAYYDKRTDKYYAWNNDNYNYEYWTCPSHLLDGDCFRVEIRLRGDWIDKRFSFVFRAENRSFVIEKVTS